MAKRIVKLATRGSELAMKQAHMAMEWLSRRMSVETDFEIVEVKTSGDRRQEVSLEKEGGTGLFTKEIEECLLDGRADIAVHSAKDLPMKIASGLALSCALPRDWCADVLAIRSDVKVPSLIATGSPRRRAQLKKLFPQAVWSDMRGNVSTRLSKIINGAADATVLSEAGIKRLGIEKYEGISFSKIPVDVCVPAVGQGIIALETRATDFAEYSAFTDEAADLALSYEREFLTALGGGCQSAFAANFSGGILRYYHGKTGIGQIELESSKAENLARIRELVSSLLR